ncbi:HPP family-domain-containing protein [Dendryphion nanum]|uniref:HPP family-domain-containing protein n=1 Tax=Dendryphion nanum TaxID=256645 RepID=A0A9P9IJD9_9PLEO|nr:HPP family-domain-containing protein [Dendryphion nanum]
MVDSRPSLLRRARLWDVDVDHYADRYIPASQLYRLPKPISRFLGYREKPRNDVGNVLGAFWSMVGAFCGLAVIAAVFNNTGVIQAHSPPALIASFGASAILEYNAIRSPLGQPRNALLGHTFSAIIGVGITKLFRYHQDFEKLRWLAGAVSCAVSSAVMLLTGTVHPPGGASAVLAATAPDITDMGWYFVGLVMWGTTLMLIVGLVINNIQRQFPMYWWTPIDLSIGKREDIFTMPDGNGGLERRNDDEKAGHENEESVRGINISAFQIRLPEDLSLNQQETQVLENLRERLRKREDESRTRVPSSRPSTDGGFGTVPSHNSRSELYA